MATGKKSLPAVYTLAGSGVFNSFISFLLFLVTHPSLATTLHFILGVLHCFSVSLSGLDACDCVCVHVPKVCSMLPVCFYMEGKVDG